jgi:hypothetical protein
MHDGQTSTTGSGPIKVDCDQVGLQFDWTLPTENGLATFQSCVARDCRRSAVDFTVDLNRLSKPDPERLNNFLVRRAAGLTSSYEVVRHLAWLLEISLEQSSAQLSRDERQRKVRELLLVI